MSQEISIVLDDEDYTKLLWIAAHRNISIYDAIRGMIESDFFFRSEQIAGGQIEITYPHMTRTVKMS